MLRSVSSLCCLPDGRGQRSTSFAEGGCFGLDSGTSLALCGPFADSRAFDDRFTVHVAMCCDRLIEAVTPICGIVCDVIAEPCCERAKSVLKAALSPLSAMRFWVT